MAFEKGSLILVDRTYKLDSGEVIDTTVKEHAPADMADDPAARFGPQLVAVGESWVIKGLDEALAGMDAGQNKTVEIPPEKGFGAIDPGKVRMLPLRKLGEDAEKVSIGDMIELDHRKGIIRFIGSGRVRIDFNHRYAGKTIMCDVTVKKSLVEDRDRIRAILERHLMGEEPSFEMSGGGLDVEIPREMFRMDGLSTVKRLAQIDLFKFVPSLAKVRFVETHENEKAAKPAPAPEKPEAAKAEPAAASS